MFHTTQTSRRTRNRMVAVVTAAAASTLVLLPIGSPPASAHEPAPATVSRFEPPYAVPLDALGGRTLAEYITEHQVRFLGPPVG